MKDYSYTPYLGLRNWLEYIDEGFGEFMPLIFLATLPVTALFLIVDTIALPYALYCWVRRAMNKE